MLNNILVLRSALDPPVTRVLLLISGIISQELRIAYDREVVIW